MIIQSHIVVARIHTDHHLWNVRKLQLFFQFSSGGRFFNCEGEKQLTDQDQRYKVKRVLNAECILSFENIIN